MINRNFIIKGLGRNSLKEGEIMILVMLSPILIIGFIALGIFEERRRSKKAQDQKDQIEKDKNKVYDSEENK